jgi:hypothetical protein
MAKTETILANETDLHILHRLEVLAREAGHASLRSAANDNSLWGMTGAQAEEWLRSNAAIEVEVEVGHASSIPGARWCRPVGWSPRNAIDGADWIGEEGSWQDCDGDAAGIVIYGDQAEGDRVTVGLDDLRVASCGDCRVIGKVVIDCA